MKLLRALSFLSLGVLWFCAAAAAQGPAITKITTNDPINLSCTYTVGKSTILCPMGPGTTLTVIGTSFGSTGGGVITCDCPGIVISSWSNTKIIGLVSSVFPNPGPDSQGIAVETIEGGYSTYVPYVAQAAQITKLVVGSCIWTLTPPSTQQCLITPGTQFTIYGNYLGSGGGSAGIELGDFPGPTIQSWDPGWTSNPTPNNNVIVATAVQAACGNSIQVFAEQEGILGSNPVPYTTCH